MLFRQTFSAELSNFLSKIHSLDVEKCASASIKYVQCFPRRSLRINGVLIDLFE